MEDKKKTIDEKLDAHGKVLAIIAATSIMTAIGVFILLVRGK